MDGAGVWVFARGGQQRSGMTAVTAIRSSRADRSSGAALVSKRKGVPAGFLHPLSPLPSLRAAALAGSDWLRVYICPSRRLSRRRGSCRCKFSHPSSCVVAVAFMRGYRGSTHSRKGAGASCSSISGIGMDGRLIGIHTVSSALSRR